VAKPGAGPLADDPGARRRPAIVGLFYAVMSPTVGFAYAGAWMLLSVIASGAILAARSTDPP
jgi:hypothetical protein